MLPKTHPATPPCAVSLEHPVLTSMLLLQGQASVEAASRGVPLAAAPQQLGSFLTLPHTPLTCTCCYSNVTFVKLGRLKYALTSITIVTI